MHYASHVDNTMTSGLRTDLSFTLFLSEQESEKSEKDNHEDGDLVIDASSAERNFRLDSGSLLLYPAHSLHRVEPVTRGQCIVIVGWIRSLVRSPEQREILFDLERSIAPLRTLPEQANALTLLLKIALTFCVCGLRISVMTFHTVKAPTRLPIHFMLFSSLLIPFCNR